MIKQYFKQALFLLKENKLISLISIIGTALAIAMIMVIVITLQVKVSPFAPETKRDRCLIVKWIGSQSLSNSTDQSNGPMAYKTAKECFKAMKTPEAVALLAFKESMLASKPAGEKMSCDVQQTDDAFWQVFDFSFINGKPYDKADFDAGLPKTVISEEVARKVFGTENATGSTILLNHAEYTVCGVVKDVSTLAEFAYGQIWIPMSSTNAINTIYDEGGVLGKLSVIILARDKEDFPAICEEAEQLRTKHVAYLRDWDLLYRGQPDTYFVASHRESANNPARATEAIRQYILVILVLLIVPAVNLSGLTLSRMHKRLSEIGVRKAFGANRTELMIQVLSENLLYSLLGGILGLLLSYLAAFCFANMLFGNMMNSALNGTKSVDVSLLLSPWTFMIAFLFCLVLNLLSAGIPAWKATRMNIVDALNER